MLWIFADLPPLVARPVLGQKLLDCLLHLKYAPAIQQEIITAYVKGPEVQTLLRWSTKPSVLSCHLMISSLPWISYSHSWYLEFGKPIGLAVSCLLETGPADRTISWQFHADFISTSWYAC